MKTLVVALLVVALVYDVHGYSLYRRGSRTCWTMEDCKNIVNSVKTNSEKCSAFSDPSCVKYRRQRRKGLDCDEKVMTPLDNSLNTFAFFCSGQWG